MSKKIIAYGMDGFITPMMKHFADEGSLPTFKRLIDEGAVNETVFRPFRCGRPRIGPPSQRARTRVRTASRAGESRSRRASASIRLTVAPTMPNASGTPLSARA